MADITTPDQTPWGSQTKTLDPATAAAQGYTMGPAGYYLDQQGNVAPGQVTPGMRDNPQGQIFYDKAKDLDYNLVNGHKVYQSPVTYENGQTIYKKSKGGAPISDTGGGALHGHPQWNPQTGSWDVNLDWGKVLSWAAAAGITAGAITAAMPAGAGIAAGTGADVAGTTSGLGAAALPGAGTALGAAGAAPLASTTLGTGFASLAPSLTPSIAGTVGTGAKFASLVDAASKIGKGLSGAGVDANGNPINAPTSAASANEADQLAKNRYLETTPNQAGPTADKIAMQNMLRAGLIAKMPNTGQPLSVGGYALPSLAPTAAGTTFAQSMQDQLAKRMANGQPLTLSGVPAPTQEELDARAKALDAAGIGKGANSTLTGIGNTINQGVRYANLGKSIYDTAKGLFT